jgi:phospholipase D1/2
MSDHPRRLLILRLVAGVFVVVALLALWRYTPARELAQPRRLAAVASEVRDSWWASPVAATAFVVAGLLLFPVTVMILATAAVFGPWQGSATSLLGSMASALLLYAVGRRVGIHAVASLAGKRVERLSRAVARRGIIAVATVRVLPLAPFSVVNLMAGAARVPLRDYLLGTAVGMGPGIVLFSLFANRVERALRHPTAGSVGVALGVAAGIALISWILQRTVGRRGDEDPRPLSEEGEGSDA